MNRLDFIKISEWIEPNSKVLDLGCADGALLKYLQSEKMTAGYGIEITPENIEKGIKNKVNIIQMNLEDGLSVFDNQFFDTVILSQTLQAMVNIEKIMDEMKRVAKNIIVSFPNFGYWKNRLQILNGKMPKSSDQSQVSLTQSPRPRSPRPGSEHTNCRSRTPSSALNRTPLAGGPTKNTFIPAKRRSNQALAYTRRANKVCNLLIGSGSSDSINSRGPNKFNNSRSKVTPSGAPISNNHGTSPGDSNFEK